MNAALAGSNRADDSNGGRREHHMADEDQPTNESPPASMATPGNEVGKSRLSRRRALTLGAIAAGALSLGTTQIAGAVPVNTLVSSVMTGTGVIQRRDTGTWVSAPDITSDSVVTIMLQGDPGSYVGPSLS